MLAMAGLANMESKVWLSPKADPKQCKHSGGAVEAATKQSDRPGRGC